MLIIPAIDIKDGCVVRYVQGRHSLKVYSKDPLKTAKHWEKSGAQYLHVVDLDGAMTGVPKNIALVKSIASAIKLPVQFGGGVRSQATIKALLDAGVQRVILGTKAVTDERFLKEAFREFGNAVMVSIDAKDNNVLIQGWQDESLAKDAIAFALDLKKIGFTQVVYTDVAKDGTLAGPNIKGIKRFIKATGLSLIASGGISKLDDIRALKKIEGQGVKGVIIGKALYEGRFTLSQALQFS